MGFTLFERRKAGSSNRTASVFKRFATCESGATAIEYSLMAIMIAIAIIAVLGEISAEITNVYTSIKTGFSTASS